MYPNELTELEDKKPPLSKLRVGYLRTLAIDKGLVENLEAASKIKKEDLLKMLNE